MKPVRFPIAEDEIEERFVRASGPGGQNVNKVATAVRLRFDARRSRSLPEEVKERLLRLAGRRVTADGILVIEAGRYRTQERNRRDARERLAQLVDRASQPVRPRRESRPSAGAVERRLEEKRRQGRAKAARKAVSPRD